jgi:hypothetical protein
MIKPLTFKKAVAAFAMLFLCGISLYSCTEEMPILNPNSISSISNNSSIVVNINNSAYVIKNKTPDYAIFASITSGTNNTSNTQYNVSGSSSSKTAPIDFVLAFATDSLSKKYIVTTSQVDVNNKTYTTLNKFGDAKLTVSKMDEKANTATGTFGYYLYDSVFTPTDSIFVSGTFNIIK